MKNLEDYEDGNGRISMRMVYKDYDLYKEKCLLYNKKYLNLDNYIKTPESLHYKYFEELNRNLTENEIIEYSLIISDLKHKSETEQIDILGDIIFHHINEYDLINNFTIILKDYIPLLLKHTQL